MKFNRSLPTELKEMLERQYKEYIAATPMTKKEQRAVREWVKDGHSVYENSSGVWADGGVPVEFLTVYRDEEYIRQRTKGMSPIEARKFALDYYGWDDEAESLMPDTSISECTHSNSEEDELPFS